MLIDFYVHNLRILNAFFRQKECHKYTWSSGGLMRVSVAKRCTNARVCRGYRIGSDHCLLPANFMGSPSRKKKKGKTKQERRIKIRATEDSVNNWLYQKRVQAINQNRPVSSKSEEEWENFKEIVLQAATESQGKVSGYRKIERLRPG